MADTIAEDNAGPSLHPLDAMTVARDHHTVLHENDRVRVLDTRLGAGGRTPVHSHQWPSVLYVPSWSDFVRYDPEGNVVMDSRSMTSRPAVGAALWSPPLAPHSVANIGDSDLHIIGVELKQP
jgi:mannose-6-phosphate isomerase-like protein (cupin superfamily)